MTDASGTDATHTGLDIEVDPAEFRSVLGHFPTGVTVVASVVDGVAQGLAVGSFFSVSLEPPLVGFCVKRESVSWSRIEPTGRFSVNILSDRQADVSNVFSSRAEDKFAEVPWSPAPVTATPWIDDAVAHIECDIDSVLPGGDHVIVLGLVRGLSVHRGEHGPLLFHKGGYGRHEAL